MISVSQQFLEDVYVNGNRHYAPIVTIALLNGTILNITENQIMSGGLTIEESVSRDFDIDMGNAPISKCTLLLNNIDGTLSDYDFLGGLVNVEISLPLTTGTTETFQRGRYIIDTASGDSVITLSCLDYMTKFDVDYSYSSLTYPATLYQILTDACDVCGVTLATTSFLNQNIKVQARPSDMTFREVIGHIAEIAGCNAFMNPSGELELRWYNIGGLAVSKQEHLITEDGITILTEDGQNLVGEIATDEDLDGYEGLAFIRSLYSLTLGREDVQITGVKAAVADDTSLVSVYTYGTTDYAISIDNNPFITQANAQTIVNRIGDKIVGMAWRKANMSHFSTPYLQAGDVALIEDAKGNEHHVIISSTTFKLQDKQSSTSAAADPMRKKAEPFSQQTQMLQRIDTALTQAVVFNKLTTDDGSSYAQSGDIEETPSLMRTMSRSGLLRASSDEEEAPSMTLEDGKIHFNADYITTGMLSDAAGRNYWNLETGDMKLTGEFSTVSDDGYGVEIDNGVVKIYRDGTLAGTLQSGTQTLESGALAVVLSAAEEANTVGIGYWDVGEEVHKMAVQYYKSLDALALRAGYITAENNPIKNMGYESTVYGYGYLVHMTNTNNHVTIGYSSPYMWFYLDGTAKYYLSQSYSDKRLKKDIKAIDPDTLDKILEIPLKQFRMKDGTRIRFGVIAQDVEKVFGKETHDFIAESPEDDTMFVDNDQILYARLAADERKIKSLEERIAKLEKLLEEK